MNARDDLFARVLRRLDMVDETELDKAIAEFETVGFASFRIGHDEPQFRTLTEYIQKNMIPTQTDVGDEVITITKRPWGSFELG